MNRPFVSCVFLKMESKSQGDRNVNVNRKNGFHRVIKRLLVSILAD